ncbi:MAG: thioredoxin family protein [Bacteroidota bacterium]|nr:thioredoxin family protein [Bacteroidota bacterium]
MKNLFCLLLPLAIFSAPWHYNLDEAKQIAQKEHKFILLNFSGSDWCGPCIQMHKEIFDDESFENFAKSNLVLVNADFPRRKKNQLSPQQQKLNDAMADKYNSQGKFPYTVLLDGNGKVLKEWDGYPNIKPEEFEMQVKSSIDGER